MLYLFQNIEHYWLWFTNGHKTGFFHEFEGSQLNLYQEEFICMSLDKNYFALLSIIYNL